MKTKSKLIFREKCFNEALEFIASKGFTHIKVELEAQLNRLSAVCQECGLLVTDRTSRRCTRCDGNGVADVVDNHIVDCTACNNGLTSCSTKHINWDEYNCKKFIYEQLPSNVKNGIVYSKFYNDGSVDSEFTFTLPIKHAVHVIDVINAFKKLADTVDQGCDTRGAGMHIAIMHSPTGTYPRGCSLDIASRNTMSVYLKKLMPALFFLGSSNYRSRMLRFREPRMSTSKYSAINYGNNVLEYRVFETCYQNPEMFKEYVEVIGRSLEYYTPGSDTPEPSLLTKKYSFVSPLGTTIARFFSDPKTLAALDETLPYLLPKSRTIEEVKNERSFKYTQKRLATRAQITSNQAAARWPEFKERLNFAAKNDPDFDLENYPLNVEEFITDQHDPVSTELREISL